MENFTQEIDIDLIDLPAHNMRTDIDRDGIFDLALDIKANGLINPITVRNKHVDKDGSGCKTDRRSGECLTEGHQRFELVAGQRRYLAHQYGGIRNIRAVVRDLDDDAAFAVMTSENLARADVHPVDEAAHVTQLMKVKNDDIDAVMKITKRSKEWVQSRLLVGQMDDKLKEVLRTNKIKLGVALILQRVKDDIDREALIGMAINQGASMAVANYWLAQWEAGLFGHASLYANENMNAPEHERRIVMLRCGIDGKDYPASEFVSVLVHNSNAGYIDAIRSELKKHNTEPESALGEN